jgi:hypothetical protein
MKLALIGAALVAAVSFAAPASAQQVIYNPGYCAQFYPNANCQNLGPGNPYTGDYQARAWGGSYAHMGYRHRYPIHRRVVHHHRHMH